MTAFGQFLRQLRKARGYTNVNEYLRKYPLPVSHVHYRHLEAGKRKISVESAKEICQALDADYKTFYYHLLKDWLPANITDMFANIVAAQPVTEPPAKSVVEPSAGTALDAHTLHPSKECCDYLNNNFECMPILWSIYAVPSTSVEQLQGLAARNKISASVDEILNKFQQFGLITRLDNGGEIIVERAKPAINFVHHALNAKILMHETQQAVDKYTRSDNQQPSDSLIYYSVVSLSESARQDLLTSISEVVGSIRRSSENASSSQSEPFFYSLVFAARPQYEL